MIKTEGLTICHKAFRNMLSKITLILICDICGYNGIAIQE